VLAILDFVFLIIGFLLTAVVWLIIANVIMSWLVAFDVINLRNRSAYNVVQLLDRATRPILAPLRKIIPPLGNMDVTPLILIVVITAAQQTLIPALYNWLARLLSGT
jgi:YggT family protein